MAAIDSTAQRLPSTRPIDHRWDRSRGIIFSNARRIAGNSHTRPSCNAIPSADAPGTTRSYAIRHLGKSTIANTPALDSTHRGTGFTISPEEGARLRAEKMRLEEEVKSLSRQKQNLEANQEAYRKELNAAKQEADRAQHRLEAEKDNLERELAKLKKEADPEKRKNESVLVAAQEAGAKQEREKYEKTIKDLKSQHLQQLNHQAEYGESINELRRALRSKEGELTIAERNFTELRDELSSTKNTNRDLEQQLGSRQQREQSDRGTYPAYRGIFNEFTNQVYSLRNVLRAVQQPLLEESKLWNASADEFQASRTLRLFHEQGQYRDLRRAISLFLNDRAANSHAAATMLESLGNKLVEDLSPFRSAAHGSRMLTRYHHFENEHSTFDMMNLAYMISNVEPFRERRDTCSVQIENIKRDLAQAQFGNEKTMQLQEKSKILHDDLTFWQRLLGVFETLRNIKAHEALLNDTPVEKAVFIRCSDAAERLRAVIDSHYDAVERSGATEDAGVTSADLKDHQIRWKELEAIARRAFDEFQVSLRKSALLEYNLGQLSNREQEEHNREIKRRIEKAQHRLDVELKALRDMKASAPRNRKALASRVPASVADLTARISLELPPLTARRPAQIIRRYPLRAITRAPKLATWKHEVKKMSRRKDKIAAGASNPSPGIERDIRMLNEQVQGLEGKVQFHENSGSSTGAINDLTAEPIKSDAAATADSTAWSTASEDPESAKAQPSKPKPKRTRPSLRSMQKRLEARAAEDRSDTALNMKPSSLINARYSTSPHALSDRRYFHSTFAHQDNSSNARTMTVTNRTYRTPFASSTPLSPHREAMTRDAGTGSAASDAAFTCTSPESRASVITTESMLGHTPQCQDSASSYTPSEPDNDGIIEDSDAESATEAAEVKDANGAPPESSVSTELTYHIPAKDYRAAVIASPNTDAAFWTYRLYKGSAGKPPAVFYCINLETAEKQAKLFLDEPVLGFDLEWESRASLKSGNIKQNVSLIQLASEDKIGLFQIALFAGDTVEKLLPPTLRTILESPGIAKTGVNIRGDATRLERCLDVKMQGIFELSHLYNVVKFSAKQPEKVNFKVVSLAYQVQNVLLLPLKKDENRVSAWSRKLNTQQTDYAASDAYAGFRLYHTLETQRKAMIPTPPRPSYHELNRPIVLGNGTEVFKYERKSGVRADRKGTTTFEGEAEDEDEEFFDALEDHDTDELDPTEATIDAAAALNEPEVEDGITGKDDALGPKVLPKTPGDFTWQQPSGIVFASPATQKPDRDSDQSSSDSSGEVTSQSKPESKSTRPDSPQLRLANTWLEAYRASNNKKIISARPNELRAYHLWHEQGLEPKAVSAILRDPPLSTVTVASYITQAIKVQDLPFDEERAREVLRILPRSVVGRYAWVTRGS